jgi:hypothetical protein
MKLVGEVKDKVEKTESVDEAKKRIETEQRSIEDNN